MVLDKALENPLDCKEIQQVITKGNQSWIFFGRIDAEAESSNILDTWWEELTDWKESDAWRDWGQEENGTTEDEMAG